MNQRRMNFTPRSSTVRSTNSSLAEVTPWTVWPAPRAVFSPQSKLTRHMGESLTRRSQTERRRPGCEPAPGLSRRMALGQEMARGPQNASICRTETWGPPERPRSRARAPALTCARMPARVLHAGDAFWRPSNQMGVLNCDLGKQLEAASLAARFWRLTPGPGVDEASPHDADRTLRRARGHRPHADRRRRAAHARAALERARRPRRRAPGVQRHGRRRAVARRRHAARARQHARDDGRAARAHVPRRPTALPPELAGD